MGLERCGFCGVPIYVRLAASWNDDGTVTGRYARGTRVVQIYADEINHILEGISERIGHDISRIIVEGERKATIQFNRDLLRNVPPALKAVFNNRVMARPLNRFLLRSARNAGLGSGRIVEYRWGSGLVADFERPFNIPVLAGDMLGTVEEFYGQSGEVAWTGDTRRVRITITLGGRASHVDEERLRPVLPPTLPGDVEYERCPRCHLPLDVSRSYEFDLAKGIAVEKETGRRIVTVIIDSLYSVFQELESELGEEIPEMIVELESQYVAANLPCAARCFEDLDSDAMRLLLGDLKVKGMGNPVDVEVSGGGAVVRIDNPFSEELLAGRVLGLYKAFRGGVADVDWTHDTEGFTVIEVKASG